MHHCILIVMKNTFKVLFASIKTLTKDFTESPIGISIQFILFHLTPHPFYAYQLELSYRMTLCRIPHSACTTP
jgi:hypothetical protein